MHSFYVTVVFSWMKNFKEIPGENFTAMFSVSCSQMLMLFGRNLGQLVYHIFPHIFSYLYAFFFRFKNTVEMPNYCCCVGGCNNDSRYPDKTVKRSHVKELKFNHFPKDESKRQFWKEQVGKGLDGFIISDNKVVCSNHFE